MKKKIIKRLSVVLVLILAVVLFAVTTAAGTLDSTYYDTGLLTSREKSALTLKPIGSVVIVSKSGATPVVISPTSYGVTAINEVTVNSTAFKNFLNAIKTEFAAKKVDTVCMAGVGSSSIGSAALAKQVAKYKTGANYVAAIVTGLGDSTAAVEGTQGWFIGRSSNAAKLFYPEPGSFVLRELLLNGYKPAMVVGHSKGCMDTASALFGAYYANPSATNGIKFKSFGCGVNAPSNVNMTQYVGSMDTMGGINTVSTKNLTKVWGKYHTLNSFYVATYMPLKNYINK